MATVPLHPALVHVPLGLAFVLPLVAAGLAVGLWRGLVPRRAWAIAVALQVIVVAAGAAAFWTGERDEKRVAAITTARPVHAHEEAAEVFLWGAGIVLAVATATLVVPRRAVVPAATLAAIAALAVAALGYRAGKAGGELVYTRGGAAAYAVDAVRAKAPALGSLAHRDRHHD